MVADPVLLRGLGFTADGGAQAMTGLPQVLEWTQADFVSRFLYQVGEAGVAPGNAQPSQEGPGRRGLFTKQVDVTGALFQPVHRIFYLAVLEVVCDTFGQPRLDPAKIDSAGMVVRRVAPGRATPDRWVGYQDTVKWYATHAASTEDSDPDEARRPGRYNSGNEVIDEQLEAADIGSTVGLGVERITQLFVAPKALCAEVGHTILFGAVQLASSEVEPPSTATYGAAEIAGLLPPHFQPGVKISLGSVAGKTFQMDTTAAGSPITYQDGTSTQIVDLNAAITPKPLADFIGMLRQMVSQYDAFEDADLMAALDGVTLTYADGSTRGAGDALKEAAGLFVKGDGSVAVTLPRAWPALTQAQSTAIAGKALAPANERLRRVLPLQGRYDTPGALYQIRAFVRVLRDDGCPPTLVWSDYSPPFSIAPWHATSKLPPIQISLPAVTPGNVKSFLPNVAFNVPPSIFGLLNANSADDFLKGKASAPGAGGLAWICGFNIPIITLCAFIVLNIFLSLLNIVFWWMAFIKICIPVPASLKAKLPNGSTSDS
jgi:hypothetical protein